ncbi:hypothetical protein BDA96_01G446000 [Sorghum bicolor]|uniref:Uncharacterized protein n=1 Tax=Sorghum bicolor TaxID=4558 RepID=A0A921S5M0_SORBI|nr:hypothetical protein BDA96_01G446000 [Sorghum bicolor]
MLKTGDPHKSSCHQNGFQEAVSFDADLALLLL